MGERDANEKDVKHDPLIKFLNSKMKEEGLSLRRVSKLIGTSHTTIACFRKGEQVDMKTIQAISNWIGIPMSKGLDLRERKSTLPDQIEVLLKNHPGLAKAFEEAVEKANAGKVDPEVLADVAAYATWRINIVAKE